MTEPRKSRVLQSLCADIDLSMLVYFRIIFGVTIFAWSAKMLFSGAIEDNYITPRLHFTYAGFHWVEPLSDEGMRILFLALACNGLAIVFGFCYRLATLAIAIGFTYVFLLDKVCYQNHYYLICLLSWIMTILPAQRMASIDARLRPALHSESVPAWTLGLLRFQIGVPYFFGGIAKLNTDWLQGQPLRDVMKEHTDTPWVGGLLSHEWAPLFFCYGGLLFDLLIVPALMWKPTRPWAFALAVVFHLSNASLFQIGVFPWFMILATVIYFPPSFPRQILQSFRHTKKENGKPSTKTSTDLPIKLLRQLPTKQKVGMSLLVAFLFFQIVIPFRHLAYSGNVSWNEAGHRFAWRMMLRGKRCGIRYYAVDPDTGSSLPIDLRPYLNEFQVIRIGRDPRMLEQLACFIADDLRKHGFPDRIRIHVMALVSLNGRKPQLHIDPQIDLSRQPPTRWWQSPRWVLPLTEPLRKNGWDVPLEEWEQHLEVPSFMHGGKYQAGK